MPSIDRHLVSPFFRFYRSFSVQARHLVLHQLSPLLRQEILLIFVLKRRKAPLIKAVMTSASPAARPVIGESIAPTNTSLPHQPTNSSKVCQLKTAALLGSSNSISEQKVVNDTLEGISDDGLVFEERFEFENSPNRIQSVKGRLRAQFNFWSLTLGANDFILRVIDKGYTIPFITVPQNAFFDNNRSALMHADFVLEAIQELLLSGSVVQVSSPPHVVNPLSVSIQSCGKKRLILDLRHVNKHIWKEKFKFEDIRNACVYLPFDRFMFKFDLKSGYHHIDILQEHQTFLGLSWVVNGVRKFFVFTVLPFGLSSAPYIFTKVVRVLVRYWRSHAVRITVYLDDGLGSARDFARCVAASLFVKTSLQLSGFLPNDSKSIWQPTSCLVWLGFCIDLSIYTISIPSERILSAVQVIDSIRSQYPSSTARKLAQFVGKIISMGFVFGNITRIMTRYSHFDILRSPTWDSKISLSGSTLNELCFWKDNIPSLNSRRLLSVQSLYTRVCYSDASSTGCASYMLEFHNTISHKMWSVEEAQKSSSYRELKAISLGLESFLPLVKGHTIKWYTDNQSVSRIVEVGSMKKDLQRLALRIFSMCLLNCITLEVEWIPRSANDRADFLSRVVDYDDWRVNRDYFLLAEEKWGPHSVDRFANHENTQLPRFNSRFWCPGTEAVDAFSVSWAGENNWLVPPIFLIPRVLNHMVALGGRATLVVPAWPSAPFWPLIFTDEGLSPIFSDFLEIPMGSDVFVLGNYKNALFGSQNFRSGVLFLRIS